MAPYLREDSDGAYLAIKLQPRAPLNEVSGTVGSELKIKITAAPVDAAANEALLRFLSERLDCPRGSVQLVRGHKSRHKVVFLKAFHAANIEAKLSVAK